MKREVKLETEEITEKSELKGELKYETDCPEAFLDPELVGLTLALPHGSGLPAS